MRSIRLGSGILALAAIFGLAGTAMSQTPSAPYGADRPLRTPVRFDIPDAISADDYWHVWHSTFTPDGETMYFMSSAGGWGPSFMEVIMEIHFLNGRWSVPQVAPFSGLYWMESPSVSRDGSRFFFDKPNKSGADIWVMDRTSTGWSEPRDLGAPVNKPGAFQSGVSVAANGNIYFFSSRDGKPGIYCARWADGRYDEPERLGDAVNSQDARQPGIAPDESFLVFCSYRPGGLGGGDLYVSFRENGVWTPARNLGPRINSGATDMRPSISPDGKYLFFTSSRGFADRPIEKPLTYPELLALMHGPENGRTHIYQVDISAILPE